MLEWMLGHDAWTTGELLRLAGGLDDEALDREFDIGHKTLRATLDHIVWNMEAWSDGMAGRPKRERGGTSVAEMQVRLVQAARDLRAISLEVEALNSWGSRWSAPDETPPVERTFAGSISHVLTHSMHHRAQALYMLRMLGVEDRPEGDMLSWENVGMPRVGGAE